MKILKSLVLLAVLGALTFGTIGCGAEGDRDDDADVRLKKEQDRAKIKVDVEK